MGMLLPNSKKQLEMDTDTNEHVWGPSAGSDVNI